VWVYRGRDAVSSRFDDLAGTNWSGPPRLETQIHRDGLGDDRSDSNLDSRRQASCAKSRIPMLLAVRSEVGRPAALLCKKCSPNRY
jgi:hypothetical protein